MTTTPDTLPRLGLLTPDELGAVLRRHRRTVLAWARAGKIPFVKLSARDIRFDLAEVEAALRANSVPATSN